jgi:DNA polymerase-3 subunit alpha
MRILVKEGWSDKETGKKGEPRLQFVLIQYLQDVLPTFAKKLIVHLNIKDLQTDLITKLSTVFQSNKGEHSVSFEVMELETIKRQIEIETPILEETEDNTFETDSQVILEEQPEISVTTEVEETKVITRLSMPSRKLKIKISNELLVELEKMQLNFKLN